MLSCSDCGILVSTFWFPYPSFHILSVLSAMIVRVVLLRPSWSISFWLSCPFLAILSRCLIPAVPSWLYVLSVILSLFLSFCPVFCTEFRAGSQQTFLKIQQSKFWQIEQNETFFSTKNLVFPGRTKKITSGKMYIFRVTLSKLHQLRRTQRSDESNEGPIIVAHFPVLKIKIYGTLICCNISCYHIWKRNYVPGN